MKKGIFFSAWVAAVLFLASAGFAKGTPDEDAVDHATDKTLTTLESSKSAVAGETPKTSKDIFSEDDFFVSESKSEPVATVSGIENTRSATSVVRARTSGEKVVVSKASLKALPEKKAVEVQAKPKESPSSLDEKEMRERWKALFSKDSAPDSIVYVVKPGDSLYVLARKNHTTTDFIKKINGLESDNIYPKMKLKIHTAPFSMLIDKSKNTLVLYSNNVAVKKYSVATGKKNCTPVGEFKITEKLLNPTWFKTGAILPPGSPENALGTRWMGFDKPAYGIHGTIDPKSIGTQASEGCIRMLNEDVEELYSIIPTGTKVTIQDGPKAHSLKRS